MPAVAVDNVHRPDRLALASDLTAALRDSARMLDEQYVVAKLNAELELSAEPQASDVWQNIGDSAQVQHCFEALAQRIVEMPPFRC